MTDLPKRHSIRLKEYDYSAPGAYFITVCVQDHLPIFGELSNGCMVSNDAGMMLEKEWLNLPDRFPFLQLDEYVIMPDHFHGILYLLPEERPGEHEVRPYGTANGSLGRIIQAFKSSTTVRYAEGVDKYGWKPFNKRLWQRGYYEHVVRNSEDLRLIREYISYNPSRWFVEKESVRTLD
jgi:putative transposase